MSLRHRLRAPLSHAETALGSRCGLTISPDAVPPRFVLVLVVFAIVACGFSTQMIATDRAWADDPLPPETSIDSGPNGTVGSANASFEFSSPEEGVEFECRLDAAGWETCSPPKSYADLSDGAHRLLVRAAAGAAAPDPTPTERNWTVDTSGPAVELSGSLKDAVDAGDSLLGPTYELLVTADDGSDPNSGVASVEVVLDLPEDAPSPEDPPEGEPPEEVTKGVLDGEELPCPQGGCSLSLDTTFKAEDITGGERTIRVVAKDELGNETEEILAVTIPDEPSQTALPDTLPCTGENEITNFTIYSLGPMFEGLPVTDVIRECAAPVPGEPVRMNSVAYLYGQPESCAPEDPLEGEPTEEEPQEAESCHIPVQIQTWPACERTLADYKLIPHVPYPWEDLGEQRSVPTSGFDDLFRVELYAGTSTLIIFGDDAEQVERAVAAIQTEPVLDPPSVPTIVSAEPSTPLPEPVAGAISGELTCPA